MTVSIPCYVEIRATVRGPRRLVRGYAAPPPGESPLTSADLPGRKAFERSACLTLRKQVRLRGRARRIAAQPSETQETRAEPQVGDRWTVAVVDLGSVDAALPNTGPRCHSTGKHG